MVTKEAKEAREVKDLIKVDSEGKDKVVLEAIREVLEAIKEDLEATKEDLEAIKEDLEEIKVVLEEIKVDLLVELEDKDSEEEAIPINNNLLLMSTPTKAEETVTSM